MRNLIRGSAPAVCPSHTEAIFVAHLVAAHTQVAEVAAAPPEAANSSIRVEGLLGGRVRAGAATPWAALASTACESAGMASIPARYAISAAATPAAGVGLARECREASPTREQQEFSDT